MNNENTPVQNAVTVRKCKCCGQTFPLDSQHFICSVNRKTGVTRFYKTCRTCFSTQASIRSATYWGKKNDESASATSPKLTLASFSDETIFEELRNRGYVGNLSFTKQVAI